MWNKLSLRVHSSAKRACVFGKRAVEASLLSLAKTCEPVSFGYHGPVAQLVRAGRS